MIDVMSFGAGVQSTTVLTLAGEGLIPMPDRWVFSDPGFEGSDTYEHLERCAEYIAKKGGKLDRVSAGNIEVEAIEFARRRANSEVKRYASIPMFVANPDGSNGIMPRQCTTEYKIEPIEAYHRREVLGLKPRQHAPKDPAVCVWIGISSDEERRASPPGRYRREQVTTEDIDLFGDPVVIERKTWEPVLWQVKCYPLLGYALHPDRSKVRDERFSAVEGWDRDDCRDWLKKVWPHPVPRSACICCPYRTNAEWADMRDNRPDDWQRAVHFDEEIRQNYLDGDKARRGHEYGRVYLHRTRVPLKMADLSEPLNDRMGCGGLWSQEPDGLCGT